MHLKAIVSSFYTRVTWCDWVSRTRRQQCHHCKRVSFCDWVSPWCTRTVKCHMIWLGLIVMHPKAMISSLYTRVTRCDWVSPWCTQWEVVILEHKGHMMWLSLTVIHSKARVSFFYTSVTWYDLVSLWPNLRQECHPFTQKSHHVTGSHCDALEGESVILVHKGHMMWLDLTVMHLKAWVSSL